MIDASISSHIYELERSNAQQATGLSWTDNNLLSPNDLEIILQALSDLKKQLTSFLITNAAGWGWCICRWAIVQLGDMSAKYSSRINKVIGGDVGRGNIHNTLPIWISMEGARIVIDMTTQCIAALKNYPDETERSVAVLLDTSVKHGANFDWAVAHVGGCFPDTVIARVLSVGLKDFVSAGESSEHTMDDKSGDGLTSYLAKEPKMSSVAGILGHLANSHQPNVRRCLNGTVRESLMDDDVEESTEEEYRKVATLPYLLHLASLSDPFRSAFTSEIRALFAAAPGLAAKIADLVPDWTADRYFPGPDNLAHHCVHLIIATSGHNGRDILELLFDLSIDEKNASRAARDAAHGCRYLLELLLTELLTKLHITQKPAGNYAKGLFSNEGRKIDLPILKAVSEHYSFFVGKYLLTNDAFQRKCILLLANLICLYKGRTAGIQTIQYGISKADDDEHCPDQLGAILQFVRDNEIWLPGIVDTAISQCITLSLKSTIAFGREQTLVDPENFMDNLAAILHAQDVDEKKQPEGGITVSRFADCMRNHHADLLPLLGHKNLIIKILKIFHFVPLPKDMSVSLMHKAAHSFVHTLLVLIEDHDIIEDQEVRLEFMLQVMDILAHIAYSHPFGLPMVLRFLMEAAIKSPFARIFGGKTPQNKEPLIPSGGILQSKGTGNTLYEENLKFGAMPTHPLGTSTSFHAGIIGQGKRPRVGNNKLPQETIDSNSLTFISLVFKLCNHHINLGCSNNRERDQAREKSKDATKQLSLLLVDLVSPDIMYNGLPWPDEDFTRVTMERDLIIVKTFEDQPLLWKIMFGLAEARPSLCYCSVLIRALLAVQMSYWQTSVAPRAELNHTKLELTKRIIELMSAGQFVPHPLDSISDVLHVMHPFHVHCILVDIWNYVRDNVPSPVSFSSNAEGALVRDFEPYKNYKQYCERLRLFMIRHISQLSNEFKCFFVDVADKQEQTMKIAMEY